MSQVTSLASKYELDPLGPVTWSVASVNTVPAKTNKTKPFHAFESEAVIVKCPELDWMTSTGSTATKFQRTY